MSAVLDRLHKMQKDMGFTEKELKDAVKRHMTPREVPLPVFHERLSKPERKQLKAAEKRKKQNKYKLAYWYLEEFLTREESNRVYEAHLDFKELVQYASQMATNIMQLQSFVVCEDVPAEQLIRDLEGEPKPLSFDIPFQLEREFDEYCKKHPLKSADDIITRRLKFRKRRKKRRKKLYSRKQMRIYDPIFANSQLDAKQMVKDMQRIGRENEIRCQRFKEMMDQLIPDKALSAQAMRMFDKRTEALMDRYKHRLDQFAQQAGLRPNRVTYDFSDLLSG